MLCHIEGVIKFLIKEVRRAKKGGRGGLSRVAACPQRCCDVGRRTHPPSIVRTIHRNQNYCFMARYGRKSRERDRETCCGTEEAFWSRTFGLSDLNHLVGQFSTALYRPSIYGRLARRKKSRTEMQQQQRSCLDDGVVFDVFCKIEPAATAW